MVYVDILVSDQELLSFGNHIFSRIAVLIADGDLFNLGWHKLRVHGSVAVMDKESDLHVYVEVVIPAEDCENYAYSYDTIMSDLGSMGVEGLSCFVELIVVGYDHSVIRNLLLQEA